MRIGFAQRASPWRLRVVDGGSRLLFSLASRHTKSPPCKSAWHVRRGRDVVRSCASDVVVSSDDCGKDGLRCIDSCGWLVATTTGRDELAWRLVFET